MRTFLLALLASTILVGCNQGGAPGASAPPTPLATQTLVASESETWKPLPRKFDWGPVATEEATIKPPDLTRIFEGLSSTPAPLGASGASTASAKPPSKKPTPSKEEKEFEIPGVEGIKGTAEGTADLVKLIWAILPILVVIAVFVTISRVFWTLVTAPMKILELIFKKPQPPTRRRP